MSFHLAKELEVLKKMIFTLSALVDENVGMAVKAVQECDVDLAREVLARDRLVDDMEVEIEEECLKILALYQPVAIDLRFIVAVLKMNNDLERIGDLSTNIAKGAIKLSEAPRLDISLNLPLMCQKVKAILKKCLDSLVNMDADLAQEALHDDDEIDEIWRNTKVLVIRAMTEHPTYAGSLLHSYSVFRRLERIADHATNIAEDVIYMVRADIVRHQHHEI
jgi:phosphate transport system protein